MNVLNQNLNKLKEATLSEVNATDFKLNNTSQHESNVIKIHKIELGWIQVDHNTLFKWNITKNFKLRMSPKSTRGGTRACEKGIESNGKAAIKKTTRKQAQQEKGGSTYQAYMVSSKNLQLNCNHAFENQRRRARWPTLVASIPSSRY